MPKRSEKQSARIRTTQYGFVYGNAEVSRVADEDGYVFIEVKTPRKTALLKISPTGLIRLQSER